ncbi:MFS transporter [Haloactinomyces albus]|uniref:MFS family permease n=1 Tax=Haloactinomyces albus TaxID=1352928 RepID=A0AAE3ZIG9_9ACTN|nr:MFS transporter [Haloactinomyces albus]MDR7304265.1 MFS family permease [Haloactinomyces albus]
MPTSSDHSSAKAVAQPHTGHSRIHLTRVITSASVALALTAPGQTAAMSVFVDPLIETLGLPRTTVSAAYMVGSLSGAVVMPFLGRLIDRFGPRRVMGAIGVCFGLILLAASAVTELVGLTAAFIGIRVGGQGALNLVATTAVAVYVHHRRGFAMGVTSAIGTAGISLAPVLLESLITDLGWREVWALEGVAVLVLVGLAALFVLPRKPTAAPPVGAPRRANRKERASPPRQPHAPGSSYRSSTGRCPKPSGPACSGWSPAVSESAAWSAPR